MSNTVVSTTNAIATGYGNQRKLAKTSNGVLWSLYIYGAAGETQPFRLRYSTDNGVTWVDGGACGINPWNSYAPNGSFFIDIDDYAHVVMKDPNNGLIYYRRGTPNAARTSYTWNTQTTIGQSWMNYPDVVAHRDGTGWVVHVSLSGNDGTNRVPIYGRMTVTSAGVVSITVNPGTGGADYLSGSSKVGAADLYPSIDFNHTGDGKTVAGGTPHIYYAWSDGGTGAGRGIRFKKATYSAGTWTWGTEREIDNARYVTGSYWVNCAFDGTRVIIGGNVFDGTNSDIILHERDAADTTTTTRTLVENATLTGTALTARMLSGSLTYDNSGNVYFAGFADSTLFSRKWTRATSTFENPVAIDQTVTQPYASLRRGYEGTRIDFVYTDGSASPYDIKYSFIGDPANITTFPSTLITSTTNAYWTQTPNQKKIDRTSNGVIWVFGPSDGDAYYRNFYSIDGGQSWNDPGNSSYFMNGSGASGSSYIKNGSFFIDIDDYAHTVFKDSSDGQLYYRRGTPNASRTAWTWSSAFSIGSGSWDYPDIVAHREGTGWAAHILSSTAIGGTTKTWYTKMSITSGNVITAGTTTELNAYASGTAYLGYPSIDFNHTGDGKTIAGGTPHLYAAWSAGSTGSGFGIRFRKATYSAGSWTWGTDREVDSTRYITGGTYWLNCLFDGTRVAIPGYLMTAGGTADVVLHERDAADTTTTNRVLLTNVGGGTAPDALFTGASTYDNLGNIYLAGAAGGSSPYMLNLRKWTRGTNTLGPVQTIDSAVKSTPWVSMKRGWRGRYQELAYTSGTSSYGVKYYQKYINELPAAPTSVVVSPIVTKNGTIGVTWQHNDADSDTQAKYQFRWRRKV